MKKLQEKHEINQFEDNCHLWNIVPGSSGKGIVLLRKIVDAIQNDNYRDPGNRLPSFLITGFSGKKLVARALANSLAIEDVRECPAKYFENGYFSHQFFRDSTFNTTHLITDIEQVKEKAEPTLWRYLRNRECHYYNSANKSYDCITYCNGLIVMTAKKQELVSESLRKATDHIITLEPLTQDQLEAVIHQRLVFCKIDYTGDEILQAIVDAGLGMVGIVIPFMEKCLMLMKSEMQECLTMEIVRRADRLNFLPVSPSVPVKDDIPF